MGTNKQHQPRNQHCPHSTVARWDRSLVTSSSPIGNTVLIPLSLPSDGQVGWAPQKQHQPHNQHQPYNHHCLYSLVAEQERFSIACTVPDSPHSMVAKWDGHLVASIVTIPQWLHG